MNNQVKFAHTNIIANDWRKLADFYVKVFKCENIFPEKKLEGEFLDKATSVKDAKI